MTFLADQDGCLRKVLRLLDGTRDEVLCHSDYGRVFVLRWVGESFSIPYEGVSYFEWILFGPVSVEVAGSMRVTEIRSCAAPVRSVENFCWSSVVYPSRRSVRGVGRGIARRWHAVAGDYLVVVVVPAQTLHRLARDCVAHHFCGMRAADRGQA